MYFISIRLINIHNNYILNYDKYSTSTTIKQYSFSIFFRWKNPNLFLLVCPDNRWPCVHSSMNEPEPRQQVDTFVWSKNFSSEIEMS